MMFAWLLTKPKLVIDLFFGGVLLLLVLYAWLAHNQLDNLKAKINIENVQDQQNKMMITDLNNRIILLQKLNDNFNKSIADIQNKQTQARNQLTEYDLSRQAKIDPKQAEIFINSRNHQVIDQLNSLRKKPNEVKK